MYEKLNQLNKDPFVIRSLTGQGVKENKTKVNSSQIFFITAFAESDLFYILGGKDGNIRTVKKLDSQQKPTELEKYHSSAIKSITIAKDSLVMVSASQTKISTWKLQALESNTFKYQKQLIIDDKIGYDYAMVTSTVNGRIIGVLENSRKVTFYNCLKVKGEESLNISDYMNQTANSAITYFDISAQGEIAVGGCHSGSIIIWSSLNQVGYQFSTYQNLLEHSGEITSIAISQDAHHIVSSGKEGTVVYWSLNDRTKKYEDQAKYDFSKDSLPVSVTISLQSSVTAVLLENGDVYLLRKRKVGQGFIIDEHLRLNASCDGRISFIDQGRFLQFTNKENYIEFIKVNSNSQSPILEEKCISQVREIPDCYCYSMDCSILAMSFQNIICFYRFNFDLEEYEKIEFQIIAEENQIFEKIKFSSNCSNLVGVLKDVLETREKCLIDKIEFNREILIYR